MMSQATKMAGEGDAPGDEIRLSVVVVAHAGYEAVRLVVRHLAAQTIAGALELLIAAPSRDGLGLAEADMVPFHSHRVVEVGRVDTRGGAAARAVGEARGAVVVLLENHSFPDPDWAESLVSAHDGPWAGVGPGVEMFNPRTASSRAMHLIMYGHATAHDEPREVDGLPWHNSSYKRDVLGALGGDLEALFESEGELQRRLRELGHRLLLDPRATTRHVSDSRPRVAFRTCFNHGRMFAASRARTWSLPRRLGYVLAAPLFPILRIAQLRPDLARIRRHQRVLDLLPLLLALYGANAVGECVGYLLGEGATRAALTRHELHTEERVRPAEWEAMMALLADRPGPMP